MFSALVNYKLSFMLIVGFFGSITSALKAQEALWGTTYRGGSDNAGTIYRTYANGDSIKTVYDFKVSFKGKTSSGELLQTSNGRFYGVTLAGGPNDQGVLYSYEPKAGSYEAEVIFESSAKGGRPRGKLVKATNGNLYGVTARGGTADSGVLYRYNPNKGQYKKLVDFSDGGYPRGGLIEAANGALYGMTFRGGSQGAGIVYKYNPTNQQFQKIHDFRGPDGFGPKGRLVEANNGLLYGLTEKGGSEGDGVIFAFDPAVDTFQVVHSFDEAKAGGLPKGSLIQASNGKLYGVLPDGKGIRNRGAIFSYNPTNQTFKKLKDFSGEKAIRPVDKVTEGKPGVLYGINEDVLGQSGGGAIFRYNIASNKLSFPLITKEIDFRLGLIKGQDGQLYGSEQGIYAFDTSAKTINRAFEFQKPLKGKNPSSRLLRTANNQLYGITTNGGKHGDGVLYRYDPYQKQLFKEVDFKGKAKGANPRGNLMQANNGKLYGMTSRGGSGAGVLFSFDPNTDSFTKELELGGMIGVKPLGGLTQAKNGKLYGVTTEGGAFDDGSMFVYNIAQDTAKNLHSFNDVGKTGALPRGTLLEANNGHLYGTASYSGSRGFGGTVFKYNIQQDTLTVVRDFGNSSVRGGRPIGSLMQSPTDGKIYGTAQNARFNEFVIFSYEIGKDSFVTVTDSDRPYYPGDEPLGTLIELENGLMYGVCKWEGVDSDEDNGLIYEFYPNRQFPSLKTVQTEFDFSNKPTGKQPRAGLIQFRPPKLDTNQVVLCEGDSIRVGKNTYRTSGTYQDTFQSADGPDSIVITHVAKGPFYDTLTPTVCDQYTYARSGRTYRKSGNYRDTISQGPGCDTIAFIQLTVNNTYDTLKDTACYKYTVPSGHETYTQSGTFMDTLTNAAGCDSLLTLELTITDSTTSTLDTTACSTYTLPSGSRSYQTAGTYRDTVTNQQGCDSLITIKLSFAAVDTGVTKRGDTLRAAAANAAYQWLNCANDTTAINGTTSRQFVPKQDGNYAVAVTKNNCTDTSACYGIQPVGLSKVRASENIAVYPNPAREVLMIRSKKEILTGAYQLKTLSGQTLQSGKLVKGVTTKIDISPIKAGVYLLTLQTEKGVLVKKVVVE